MRGTVIVAVAVLAGAGCKKTLHFRTVEGELMAKLGHEAPMTSAECDETEVRAGAVFDCHLAFKDGGKVDAPIELMDTLGSWQLRGGYVAPAHAAKMIRDTLEQQKVSAEIDCGKGLLLVGHHRCTAKASDGTTGTFDFYLDEKGDARWRLLE